MSDILPCPFCGSARRPTITAWVEDPGFGYTICCDASGWSGTGGCGASGGWGETPEEAIDAWNRRAALSQNTLHSSSEARAKSGLSTAMTTLAAEESVVPNSDPRPTSSPVSEQAGGDRSSPGASPSAAQFSE